MVPAKGFSGTRATSGTAAAGICRISRANSAVSTTAAAATGLIGIGAIVLNGARIGKNCLVGAGALVTEGKAFPDGSLIVGVPARVVRTLDAAALASKVEDFAAKPLTDGLTSDDDGNVYLSDMEHSAVHRLSPDGHLQTLLRDPRLRWPDGFSFGPDGWLYVQSGYSMFGQLPGNVLLAFRVAHIPELFHFSRGELAAVLRLAVVVERALAHDRCRDERSTPQIDRNGHLDCGRVFRHGHDALFQHSIRFQAQDECP